MKRSIYARYGWHLTLFLAALFPFIVYSCMQVMRTGNNNVQQWLPDGFIETQTYDEFREIFQEREISIVSWDGATIDDPRIQALTDELRKPLEGPDDPRRYFNEVTNGGEVVRRLMGEPFGFTRELAIERLRSFVVGLDDQACGVMFGMTPAGDVKRRFSIDAMYDIASRVTGIPKEQLHLAGAPVANAAVDRESAQSIVGYVGLAILAGGFVASFSLRSFRLIAIILLVAGYCGLAGLSLVWPLGGRMNLVLVVMPVLVGMVGLSGAIHMVGYYREAIAEVGRENAAWHTVKMCWMPCALSSFTTSLGLVSLCWSEIRPVRDFGFFSAIGTLVGFAVLMAWTPTLLEIWPAGTKKRDDSEVGLSHLEEAQYAWLVGVAQYIVRHRNVVLVISMGVVLFMICGLPQIKSSVKPLKFFASNSAIHKDFLWYEETFGPLVPIEVVIPFNNDTNQMTMLERMELVKKVEESLRNDPRTQKLFGSVVSAATFAPNLPPPINVQPGEKTSAFTLAQRKAYNKKITQAWQHFSNNHFLGAKGGIEYWRVSARTGALVDMPYDRLSAQLHDVVEPVIQEAMQRPLADGGSIVGIGLPTERRPTLAIYTGMDPVFSLAQRKLFEGLLDSFAGAFWMIGPLLMFQLRGIIAGLIAMVPNIIPTLLVFGLMGWLGVFVDVGSMMTASVAIGISVDDTLHFLTWFRRALQEGKSRNEALMMAYHHCGPAMLQTNLMVALSMGVFAMTTFLPVSRFGLIMFLTLIFGVLCELVLIPAILTSPMGRFFYPGPPSVAPELQVEELEEAAPSSLAVAKTMPPKPRFSTVN